MEQEMNPNVIGFCWFNNICIAIWWNPNGYVPLVDDMGNPIYGAMQANIHTIKGESQEEDINSTCDWGSSFPLNIAVQVIDQYGGWIKPARLEWRPRPETNSPLRFKLKYKGENMIKPQVKMCGGCNKHEASQSRHYCPFQHEINDNGDDDYCDCCEDCMDNCRMSI
jgi:hypothetical protein